MLSRPLMLAAVSLMLGALGLRGQAAPGRLTVQVDRPGVKISPTFNGLMIEDISHSIDGGLYAELIQNRAFSDNPNTPVHWSVVQDSGGTGTITLDKDNLVPGTALTHCLRLDITAAGVGKRVGAANDGYWGIPSFPNTTYRASFYAKAAPNFTGPLTASIESNDGQSITASILHPFIGPGWKKYTFTLTTGSHVPVSASNRFVISAQSPGTLWLSQVSLMPPTYRGRPNGARIDLMEKLAGMHARFIRLPGGNYLEGMTMAGRFDWKKTIGDVSQRPGHQNPWGYYSDDGFGLLEYLEWCEDLHMQPVLAVWAGYTLNGKFIPAGPGLTPYVQDALDEIEYVTGGTNTKWGARRVADGHSAAFPLTYVEISNEDGRPSYNSRFAQFFDAIKAKYPKLKIIATSNVTSRKADVVDEHYYLSAAEMAAGSGRYDAYPRTGPKIFVGEWATVEGNPTPTMQAALGDAAWLTGLERNSDLVVLESYAPLLVNVNPGAAQWGTNLIGLNALRSYNSPSYYVQQMFAANTGDVVLPVTVTPEATAPPPAVPLPRGRIGVATWATQAEFKDISVTQGGKTLYQKNFAAGDADWTLGAGQWQVQDGVLRQTSDATDCRADAGDANWADYTYSLKARKLSGREGFLISFHEQDGGNRVWWNLGGWGNSHSALQTFRNGIPQEIGASPTMIETGRWYDIKIEVQGRRIRCFLDGKLLTDIVDTPPSPPAPLYAAASRDLKTGDILLKVVNTSALTQRLQVDLRGAKGIAKSAVATALAGEPGDVNSLEAPEKVAPKTLTVNGIGSSFAQDFPAHSVTALRIHAR